MCQHLRTTVSTSGQFTFCNGDIADSLVDTLVCLDCGEVIAEAAPTEAAEVFEPEVMF